MVGESSITKAALRAALRARRDAIPVARRQLGSAQLVAHGLAALREQLAAGQVAAAYWPLHSEADPRPLAQALAGRGVQLALPVVDGEALLFRRWHGAAHGLVAAGFGALAPATDAPLLTPDLLLVPLLGFDRRGHRLGWGKGCYDRYLAARRAAGVAPLALGVAFAAQEVAAVPVEAHDQRLDAVLTECGCHRC